MAPVGSSSVFTQPRGRIWPFDFRSDEWPRSGESALSIDLAGMAVYGALPPLRLHLIDGPSCTTADIAASAEADSKRPLVKAPCCLNPRRWVANAAGLQWRSRWLRR